MTRHPRVCLWTACLLSASVVGAPSNALAATDNDPIDRIDPALVEQVEVHAGSGRVTVEIVTADTHGASFDARANGGIVTGVVPGQVLQASMPVGRVDDLARAADSAFLRTPLIANRPVTSQIELGPTTGENVAVVNAAAWHTAGITGSVRVGIIDFFDLNVWNVAEHGPLPPLERRFCLDTSTSGFCPADGQSGEEHGVAVAEVIKDVAPDAELFLATVGTTSDLRAAIDFFAANNVALITRSLGAAYDGPGDGTGPLAAVVDYAAAKGITWFNSAGNDAVGRYGRFIEGVDANGYVDFLIGPDVDTTMTITPGSNGCVGFDGVRWSDWYEPATQRSDYVVELYGPGGTLVELADADQTAGAPPLEAADLFGCPGTVTVKIRLRVAGAEPVPGIPVPDIVEVALFDGKLEYRQAGYSAAKPIVDSRNPALIAVGAIDPAAGATIATYSSQGPTNDGRIKPDLSAPSCLASSIYNPARSGAACFNGTSAAAPTAAAVAALLASRGLATNGVHVAALTRHLTVDLGAVGPDNEFGAGRITLPPPPTAAVDVRPAAYTPLAVPRRILDTRHGSGITLGMAGPHPRSTVIDLPIPDATSSGATAIAISVVSVDATAAGYVQAIPTLMGPLAGSSTLNVATPGQIQPNFAIVPVGAGGSISLYLFAGGNVVVDLLGTFVPTTSPAVAAGRFIAVDPVRLLDTRPESGGPVSAEWVPHRPAAGETVRIVGVPAGASAAVVNVVADQAAGAGYLRAQATGAAGLQTSSGNYVAGAASGTLSIVPVGADGTISVFTSNATHLVVDLMGYFTNGSVAPGTNGLFVAATPTRTYDSRVGAPGVHLAGTGRSIGFLGLGTPAIPAGASAVSMNLTADAANGAGYVTAVPSDRARPLISNLNFAATEPRANAVLVRLATGGSMPGSLNVFVNQTTHVIIDVNGYFTGTT
jgi:Subtilase family